MVDAGNNVAANGTSGLVVLTQLQPITVVFPLAQDYLSQVLAEMQNGQSLRVEAFDRTHANAIAQGELATIDNQVDPATGTFRLKGTFKNDNTALWPGEFVNLRFIVSVRKNALTVPTRSVQRGPKGNYIFVVKQDSTVEMRNIEVAQTDQDVAVITKGLNAGENIVVDGQYRLEQGTKVALQTPQAGDKS
jgi:multidrug efflux system membrane fusion protein